MIYSKNILLSAEEELINDLVDGLSSDKTDDKYVYTSSTKKSFYGSQYLGKVNYDYYDDDNEEYDITIYDGYCKEDLFGVVVDPSVALKINGFSNELLLQLMAQMIEGNKGKLQFYGILLTDNNGNFVNPCNPIVAMELIKKIPYDDPTIIMYPTGKHSKVYVDEHIEEEIISMWAELITYLSTECSSLEVQDMNKEALKDLFQNSNKRTLYDKISMSIDNAQDNKDVLVTPVQVGMYGGIAFPFYGAIYSENIDGTYMSSNIMPMVSANIDDVQLSEIADGDDIYQDDSLRSTCIGDNSSSSSSNFIHMNTMNGSSTFHNAVVSRENLGALVRASITMSYNILKGGLSEN